MPQPPSAELLRRLEALDREFDDAAWLNADAVRLARERAIGRALLRVQDRELDAEGVRHVLRIFASEMLSGLAVELVTHQREAAELVGRVSADLQLDPVPFGHDVLRSPDLLALPPGAALEVQLGLLALFAPLTEVALWAREPTGGLRCLCTVGHQTNSPDLRDLAQRLLADENGNGEAAAPPLVGAVVERWQQPVAALVGRARDGGEGRAQTLLLDARSVLGAIVERDGLLTRNAETERALSASGERRLTRLGLDLHDGPLQDLALLAEDLRMFREQLADRLAGDDRNQRLLGRVDDFEAQLEGLDADLRRVATSLQSPLLMHQTFPEALKQILQAFETRSGIRPRLSVSGDLSSISMSQQMALLAVVRESLSNIREHSGAGSVAVAVSSRASAVQLRIEDDGCGFDVEPTLVRAARDGHLGLVGMHERIRLLGGHSEIVSKPGSHTVLTATMPHWQPVAGEHAMAAGRPARAAAIPATQAGRPASRR